MRIIFVSVAIFFIIFCLVFLARAVFLFMLNQAYKNYQKLKKLSSKNYQTSPKNYKKEEEELLRKRHIPRAHSAIKAERKNQQKNENYELLPSQDHELDQQEMGRVEIVDLAKPIGFWTSMILGQKLTYLIQSAQALNKRGNKGFWVSMIEAKDRAAGRQHGRGM